MKDYLFMIALIVIGFIFLGGCGRQGINDIRYVPVPGPAGSDGKTGSSCTVQRYTDGSQITCTDGTSSFVSNGVDASTQITIVQFCPGTPHYPDTFPEVGFLIGGKMFAIYSKNDGFLTYLPPGRYNSNAVGSNCDFTLNADGTVSP